MPGQRRTPALPRKPKSIVEQRGDSADPVCIDLTGGKFDRKSYPVKSEANFGDDRCI